MKLRRGKKYDRKQPIVDQQMIDPEEIILLTRALFGKLVQDVNHKLNAGLEFEKLLNFIFDSLGLLIPYDRMGIALVDDKAENLRLTWVRSKIPINHLQRNYSAPLKESSLSKVISTGEPRVINDLLVYATEHPESESTKLILRDGIRSSLAYPLKIKNRPVGIVFFSSCHVNSYDHDHIDTFGDIAAELAVIIEQSQLRNAFSDTLTKTQTLRMVLHDLKAPLGIIQGYVDLSMDEDWYQNLNADAKKIFSTLRRNTDYMFQLLGDLSEFAQLQRELEVLNVTKVNLKEFFEQLTLDAKILSQKKEILFFSELKDNPENGRFDRDQIRRVLDNLITNAVKFSKRGSDIFLRVESSQGHLVFTVSDKGQGIAKSELPKLFQEFGKTSTCPTEGESSTGLGLAIARKIVEKHGGQISVSSQLNKGSTFTFWIPV